MLLGFLVVITFAHLAHGARILGVVPTPSYSHQIVFRPLWRELALRGHQVTVLTTNPVNNSTLKNLKEIDLSFSYQHWNVTSILAGNEKSPIDVIEAYFMMMIRIMDLQLDHPEVRALIENENETFDVVIVEYLFPIMFAFGERFECPTIGMTTFDAPNGIYKLMGNPAHPILNPDVGLPFVGQLNFIQRVGSVIFDSLSWLLVAQYRPLMLDVVKKHFGHEIISLDDIMKNVSLLFVNTDPILHTVRPLVPTVIQIGGAAHLTSPKPLPTELKVILDESKNGFVYFSLGTNVKIGDLPESFLDLLMKTFSELPYKVIWKFDSNNLPNKPDNVLIRNWFPQQDVLRHPNIKAFITQCGRQSVDEAFHNQVPMIGMPIYGEQVNNAKQMVSKGLGVSVDYKTVKCEELQSIILDVAENSKYRDRLKHLVTLALDQPMSGLEKAVWWTEYVIRHEGALHLRSPALDLPLYQYYLLNVIASLAAVAFILSLILFKTVKILYRSGKKILSLKLKKD